MTNTPSQSFHTHPISAADRSAASLFIDRFGDNVGITPYFVQMSRSDERKEREGSRSYYWTKDLNVQARPFIPPDKCLLALVDVDQYIDMPSLLANEFKPCLIYTFQPTQVAAIRENYSYTFDANDNVHYSVTGGASYDHRVWKYGTDHVLVTSYVFGFAIGASAYLIDRRPTDEDHELILFTPVARWSWKTAWLATWLKGQPLERLRVCCEGFLRLFVHRNDQLSISTGLPGKYVQATIPAIADDALASISRTSKFDLTMAQAMSFVDGDRIAAAPLLEYHRSLVTTKPDVVYPVECAVRRYQFEPESYDPEAKPTMVAFMHPFLDGAYAPDACASNERACITGRVESVKTEVEMTPFLYKTMK